VASLFLVVFFYAFTLSFTGAAANASGRSAAFV
jgi:hypothetical protein